MISRSVIGQFFIRMCAIRNCAGSKLCRLKLFRFENVSAPRLPVCVRYPTKTDPFELDGFCEYYSKYIRDELTWRYIRCSVYKNADCGRIVLLLDILHVQLKYIGAIVNVWLQVRQRKHTRR